MRRANGTGSISYLGKGRKKPYVVRESYKDDDGLIRQRTLGTWATRRDAQAWLDCYNADRLRGVAPPPGAVTVTIGELWEAWSARELKDAGKSKRNNYITPYERRLVKYSKRRIRDMRTDDWQEIIDADVRAGLSPGSVSKLKVLIGVLSRYAMERDYISKDYTQFVKLPEARAVVEKGALTREQLDRLHQMARDGVKWADVCLIYAYTGFRLNELLDLTPASYSPDHGGILTGGSKTDAGKGRIVPVHRRIAPYLAAWMAKKGAYIIPGRGGGRMSEHTVSDHVKTVMAALGVPAATCHWLRHTFASMATEAGVDQVALKWIMGHSTEQDITNHYTHLSVEYIVGEMAKIP